MRGEFSVYQPELVIGVAGFTKSQKSETARRLANKLRGHVFEMSDIVRSRIRERGLSVSVDALLEEISGLRRGQGKDCLAAHVCASIESREPAVAIVAGIRNINDHDCLSRTFKRYESVYVHSSRQLRHDRMLCDATSIAKTPADFSKLDEYALNEDIAIVAGRSDYVIVNEPDYPLSLDEQIRFICEKVAL